MPSLDHMQKISPQILLKLIQKSKDFLKQNKVMQEVCHKYDFDIEDLDLIPVKFDDIDVSAKTDKGIITLNVSLLELDNIHEIPGYLCHEMTHHIQQSNKPTQSADDGDYLSNPSEQEAFQFQIKYIDEQFGEDKAEDYVDQVLDHHDETGKERVKKQDILMNKVE